MILRFEPLEYRQLLAFAATNLPDLVDTAFSSTTAADWGGTIEVKGTIANDGTAPVPPGALAGIYASAAVNQPHSKAVGNVDQRTDSHSRV